MPVNLNALLRYKTIDSCLRNKQIKCTIELLINRCSQALSQLTGVEISISERTIRNDIRVLRSDLLNFNAPIIYEDGVYKYDNPDYSIFGRPIKELDLLTEIQNILVENFEILNNKNTSHLLIELAKITNHDIPDKCKPRIPMFFDKQFEHFVEYDLSDERKLKDYSMSTTKTPKVKTSFFAFLGRKEGKGLYSWDQIFKTFDV